MDRNEIVEKFCELSTEVSKKVFGSTLAADCFCGANPLMDNPLLKYGNWTYQFDQGVFDYIKAAVDEKMKRENVESYRVMSEKMASNLEKLKTKCKK